LVQMTVWRKFGNKEGIEYVRLTMWATRKAREVPCAAEHSTAYNDVAAGQSHTSGNGREQTITALT
jgi:hypothetical protein